MLPYPPKTTARQYRNAWYEGPWTYDRRWLLADERGSVIASSDVGGSAMGYNAYDEYGAAQRNGSPGRFGYTGQTWIAELGLNYYKARFYNPKLPRFLQPDPLGWAAGPNDYDYVGGDPVNFVDPLGLEEQCISWKVGGGTEDLGGGDIGITASRLKHACYQSHTSGQGPTSYYDGAGGGGGGGGGSPVDRCAARVTPPRVGKQTFSFDPKEFATKAAQKYLEHTWLLDKDWKPHSVFGGKITSPEVLASMAIFLVSTREAVPAGSFNVRVTGNMGVSTGRDIRSPLPNTTYLTVVLGPPNGILNGLPRRKPVSMHPGC